MENVGDLEVFQGEVLIFEFGVCLTLSDKLDIYKSRIQDVIVNHLNISNNI